MNAAGLPWEEAPQGASVLVAALVVFRVTHGLGLIGKPPAAQEHHQDAAHPPAGTPPAEDAPAQARDEG